MPKYDQNVANVVRDAIERCPLSMAEAARLAGLSFNRFKRYALLIGKYSPNQAGKGCAGAAPSTQLPLVEILAGLHPTYGTTRLKKRLLKEGLIPNQCEVCNLPPFWNGRALVLQLDHLNGDSTDHRRLNLRLVCPNCHSQTDSFAGKNAAPPRRGFSVSDDQLWDALQSSASVRAALVKVGLTVAKFNYSRCKLLTQQRAS